MEEPLPAGVRGATERAGQHDFAFSCEPLVGRVLATLAAAVPDGGRVLEIGTGVGVGTEWLLAGLAGRTDVRVVTVERDPDVAAVAAVAGWPDRVRLEVGDGDDRLMTADLPVSTGVIIASRVRGHRRPR